MFKLIIRAVTAVLAVSSVALGIVIQGSQGGNLSVAVISEPSRTAEAVRSTEPIQPVKDELEPEVFVQEPSVSVQPETNLDSSSQIVAPKAIKTAADMARTANETIFTTMASQVGAPWGLDKLDGTRDNTYNYISDGTGVRVYIVDTGVDATHREFGSRVIDGYDAFGENLEQTDCDGHGTHVAGIVAGNYYGVAKAATIVPVRVMDCNGVGNTTTLTSGINWILANHSGGVGIVNMSIGGRKDDLVDSAVSKLISAGMVVVAAAGNSNIDACGISPASAPGVIAVGATDQSDVKTGFSNWGQCVDIFAPGDKINSANAADDNISLRMSGTSQASPFVAGAIATYLSSGLLKNPAEAQAYAQQLAVNGVVRVQAEPEQPIEQTPEPTVEPEPVLPEPEPSPSPVVDEPIISEVTVTQNEVGSLFGKVRWTPIEDATEYRIYKTGSIRPGWRLYWTANSLATHRNISDAIGSISIYRVVAVVGGQEVVLGEVKYEPTD